MKTFFGNPYLPLALVVLVAVSVLFAGCTSDPSRTPASSTAAPAATAGTAPVPGAVTGAMPGSTSLPYGVSIAVPATWMREDLLTSGERDYGRTTVRIATFTSPGDAASGNTLTVDIDKSAGSDFEGYFNKATLAVEKTYDTADHGHAKSVTLQISGYKSYELDFDSLEVKGSYIFTSTDKGMYIFAFKGPNKPVPVHMYEGEISDMIKSIRITPSDK